MKPNFFKVFDTETTGLSAFHDQIVQFAGVTLDQNLEYVEGGELVMDIKLRSDVIPSPLAFAVHRISPDRLLAAPDTEFSAASKIKSWFLKDGKSMLAGFNSISFDDEMLRNTFYRTMNDPYDHEWRNGNFRSDVFLLVMFIYAFRPETLKWPVNEEGKVSLKLGDLAKENGIKLENAHDALEDVRATVELMRLIRSKNPAIWDYFLSLSDKKEMQRKIERREPMLLVERFLPRTQGHCTMVLPVITSASQSDKMICVDLRENPEELLSLEPAEIRRRLFTPSAELAEGESLKSIRTISSKKVPLVAPLGVIKGRPDLLDHLALDVDKCLEHARMIEGNEAFRARLQEAMKEDFPACKDAYEGIYSLGFISRDEQNLRADLRSFNSSRAKEVVLDKNGAPYPAILSADCAAAWKLPEVDSLRMTELAVRAKFANFSKIVMDIESYTPAELKHWYTHYSNVLYGNDGQRQIDFEDQLNTVKAQNVATPELASIMKGIKKHVFNMNRHLSLLEGKMLALEGVDSTPQRTQKAQPEDRLASVEP